MSYLFNYYAKCYDSFMKFFRLDRQEEIINLFSDVYNMDVCDVGGGTGVLADVLVRKGHRVTIIDPSIPMTKIARKRNQKIKIINKPIQQIESRMKYDYIVFKDTFHHISQQKEVLVKCHQMLKDEGKIIIQDFSPRSFQTKLLFLFEICCFEKIFPIADATLLKMMGDVGYQGKIKRLNKRDYIVIGDKQDYE
ncbi:MAG: class I SAM-dependent methyltransferase [Epulopiscium sp.]|nr:class I SAM-dependent methyltransferase [Candidatus Epulonipiscium sp.]